jgi:cellulose synthase operon protein C
MTERFVKFSLAALLLLGTLGSSRLAVADDKNANPLSDLKMKAGDEKGNDLRALKAELMIADQESKAVTQIQKLLKKYKGTSLEPELLLRLGELYMRRSKTDRFLELHRDSDDVVRVAPTVVKNAASRKQIENAIAVYDDIEKRFNNYEKLDAVIFDNAFANQQINNESKAEKLYIRLVTTFSESSLLPDAHLALGEIQFSRHEFKEALAHFQAIRKYPESHIYPYGMYKAAWTFYNLRDAKAGMHELEDVIRYGRYVHEQGIDERLDLRKEALLDLALFYEDNGDTKDAYAYLTDQAGELDVSPVVIRLAELYKRHGRNQDILYVLGDLIRKKPTSEYLPLAYVEMMTASENLKKHRDVVVALESFYDVCQPQSSWSKAQSQDLAPGKESPLAQFSEGVEGKLTPSKLCSKVFERIALGYANKWLKDWNKAPQEKELAEVTERAFEVFLKSDPSSDESSRARFVYAELLFKLGKFRIASQQYATTGQLTKDKNIGHDSRYFALISLEKAVNDKWSDTDEKTFQVLAKDYLTKNVGGKYALEVEFKVAFIAYEKGRYDEAGPVFLKLGQAYPTQEKGIKSQDLYLDILNIKKDYVGLRDYALALRAKTTVADRKEKLTKIYEEAYFSIIQGMEQKGDYKTAANEYNNFAKINPASKLTQKALWNSTELNFKTGDMVAGAQAAVRYFEKYPDTKEGIDALMKAAQTYESMGQLNDAAKILIKLSQVDKESKNKWLLLAADFFMLSHDAKSAKPIFESLKQNSNSDVSMRALMQLEMLAKEEGNVKQREGYLRQIAATDHEPQASVAAVYFVEKAFDEGRLDDAFNLAKKVIGEDKKGGDRSAMARARLVQARVLASEFRTQSIKSQLERVQAVLMLKTEKLSKAQVAFQSAANYGDAHVSMIAYKELADCYLSYSEALHSMPLPKGVPDAEAEAFRGEMDKLAIPMEEKGIDTKMQALNLARQLGTDEEFMSNLENELKKLNQAVTKNEGSDKIHPAMLVLPVVKGEGA